MEFFRLSLSAAIVFFCAGLTGSHAIAATITFPGFGSTSGLNLSGNAAVVTTADGQVMRLATTSTFNSGSVFATPQVSASGFSSAFAFRFTDPGGISTEGADGLALVIQPLSSALGGSGGGLGYEGIANSVAVEFDTYQNGWDPDNSHVAIDQNGDVASPLAVYSTGLPTLQNGARKFAWVDYNGTTLEVRLSEFPIRTLSPVLTQALDIPAILGAANGYLGFTGATGSAYLNHDLIAFRYSTTFAPISDPIGVPEPSSLLLLGSAFAAGVYLRRRN